MSEFYNDLYSTADVFTREVDAITDMSDRNRGVVAAALAESWSEFEDVFGDAKGFKEAAAKTRTRYRLDLLKKIEALNDSGRMLEARGVHLLALYLRGIGHVQRAGERHMASRLRCLIETDLRQRVLVAETGKTELNLPTGNTTRH